MDIDSKQLYKCRTNNNMTHIRTPVYITSDLYNVSGFCKGVETTVVVAVASDA